MRDSKIALKARLNAAHSQAEQNGDTIKRLRAELAAANERLALQGAHFMEQMRRLGAGTLPAAGQTRRPVTQGPKLTLSERVARSRPPLTPVPKTSRPVSERTRRSRAVRCGRSRCATPADGAAPTAIEAVSQPAPEPPSAVVIPLTAQAQENAGCGQVRRYQRPSRRCRQPSLPRPHRRRSGRSGGRPPAVPPRKPRLIDRISNISKA